MRTPPFGATVVQFRAAHAQARNNGIKLKLPIEQKNEERGSNHEAKADPNRAAASPSDHVRDVPLT